MAHPGVVDVDRRCPCRSAPRGHPRAQRGGRLRLARHAEPAWLDATHYATLDLSGPWRLTFETMLPDAVQVADPFHVVKLANTKLDDCHRRVQNETPGHRGHKHDPLYRCRRLLARADERLQDNERTELLGLLEAGDPAARFAWHWQAKAVVRSTSERHRPRPRSRHGRPARTRPPTRILPARGPPARPHPHRLREQIAAWHHAHVSDGFTEAANNLIKRVKRVAFGFPRFRNYRIRALLDAGRPNWHLLTSPYRPKSH